MTKFNLSEPLYVGEDLNVKKASTRVVWKELVPDRAMMSKGKDPLLAKDCYLKIKLVLGMYRDRIA